MRSSRTPSRDRELGALLEEGADVVDDVVVARVVLHRARLAEHVHEAAVAAAIGDEAGELGLVAEGGDVVDVGGAGVDAPRAATVELRRVDADLRAARRAAPATTGNDAAQLLVDSPPARRRGRVDSPPTSRMSAPCAMQLRAVLDGAIEASHRPPSENESGVTLTMPMMRAAIVC